MLQSYGHAHNDYHHDRPDGQRYHHRDDPLLAPLLEELIGRRWLRVLRLLLHLLSDLGTHARLILLLVFGSLFVQGCQQGQRIGCIF